MAPKNNNKPKAINHAYKGLREPFLTPGPRANASTSVFYLTADSSGNANFAQILAPLGLTSVTLGASAYTAGTLGNVTGPPLRGLYNRCVDFQWYRVTRAKLVFVSAVGSTVIGQVTLAGYTDPADVAASTIQTYLSGTGTRTFDLASASTREISVPIPVDSTWKKCSSVLSVPGNSYPYTGASAGSLASVANVSDLSFGAVQCNLAAGTANQYVGTLHLDYDIEFKNPIDFSINA